MNKKTYALSVVPLDVFSRAVRSSMCYSYESDKIRELIVTIEKQGPPACNYGEYILDKTGNEIFLNRVLVTLNN
ncbi:MAG TPA: hypothetical protein VJC06_00795 [Candidatus Paceibacterota bacterium]